MRRWYAPSSRHLRALLSVCGKCSFGGLGCCSCRVCVCVGGVVLCRCVCVCDLLICLRIPDAVTAERAANSAPVHRPQPTREDTPSGGSGSTLAHATIDTPRCISLYIDIQTYTHISMYTHIYICTHTHTYIYVLYICIYRRHPLWGVRLQRCNPHRLCFDRRAQVHIYIYIYILIHIYICTYISG